MNYKAELQRLAETLKESGQVPDYFIQLFLKGQMPDPTNKKKNVGIIGDEFLSLYVRAYGLTPVFLNGGSYYMGENASDMFPQISDPVAKASLGFLLDEEMGVYKNVSTVLISATNDSYKKCIDYIRARGINVIEVAPPSYVLEKMPLSYILSQIGILNHLSKVANTRLSVKVIQDEITQGLRTFELSQSEKFKNLSTIVHDFLLQTIVLAESKAQWQSEVTRYLESLPDSPPPAAIVLMGSALLFPCSKMHEIFSDVGIDCFQNICGDLPEYHKIPVKENSFAQLKACFAFQYHHGFSSQTLANTNEYRFSKSTAGVVYHLLKGQISSAYEAEQMEKAALAQDIPFLCVETDYTYADKEQLKIRIEAFCEMLRGKGVLEPVAVTN